MSNSATTEPSGIRLNPTKPPIHGTRLVHRRVSTRPAKPGLFPRRPRANYRRRSPPQAECHRAGSPRRAVIESSEQRLASDVMHPVGQLCRCDHPQTGHEGADQGHIPQVTVGSYLVPLSIDDLVVAASMVPLTWRHNGPSGGGLAWSGSAGDVLVSLAANMADARPEVISVRRRATAVAFAGAPELSRQQRPADCAATSRMALVQLDVLLSIPGATPTPATPDPTPSVTPAPRPEPLVTTQTPLTPPQPASKPPLRVSLTGVAPAPPPPRVRVILRPPGASSRSTTRRAQRVGLC